MFAISRSVTRSKLPPTPIPMIGEDEASNFWTLGTSSSSGSGRARGRHATVLVADSLRSEPHANSAAPDRTFVRGRVDLLEARHGRERLLQGTNDELLDLLGTDAAVADAHCDALIGHAGSSRRQAQQRDAPSRITTMEIMNIVTAADRDAWDRH